MGVYNICKYTYTDVTLSCVCKCVGIYIYYRNGVFYNNIQKDFEIKGLCLNTYNR